MEDWLVSLQKTVPLLQQAGSVEEIKKGHSADRKYRVELAAGGPAVLRVASYEQAGQKEQEYARLQALQPLPIKASRPLDFGVRKEWGICYMLVSYIEGEDARDALPTFTDSEQQQVGFWRDGIWPPCTSSRLPRRHRHGQSAVQKHRMYAAAYAASASAFKDGERILAFIDRHLPLLAGRPSCFCTTIFTSET